MAQTNEKTLKSGVHTRVPVLRTCRQYMCTQYQYERVNIALISHLQKEDHTIYDSFTLWQQWTREEALQKTL